PQLREKQTIFTNKYGVLCSLLVRRHPVSVHAKNISVLQATPAIHVIHLPPGSNTSTCPSRHSVRYLFFTFQLQGGAQTYNTADAITRTLVTVSCLVTSLFLCLRSQCVTVSARRHQSQLRE
ncbi:unnamed protein product, partial [Ectocarpus sp. 4 AP-2014]